MESQRDRDLLRIHNRSGLTTPDGMPMVWAAWCRTARRPPVYGPDLMLAVLGRAVEKGWSSFLYGGGPGTADLLARRLTARLPGLRIAGTWTPPFRELTPEEDADVVQRINDSGAELVWIGLSTPKQERWMAAHSGLLGERDPRSQCRLRHPRRHARKPRADAAQRTGWAYRLVRSRRLAPVPAEQPAFVLGVLRHPPRLAVDATASPDSAGVAP
jgi:N-acetylglucosaminyldiphosphoundecaprenol N-acetyl-beta-D-mannosaminyltransferase